MIRDHQHRPLHPAQMFASFNPRPAQQHNRRTHQQIMHRNPQPVHRPGQCPTRIVIRRARRRISAQHALQVPYRAHRAEPGLAEVHLIAVLQRAQQFHPVQRTQPQVGIQIRILAQRSSRASRHSRDQFRQRTARATTRLRSRATAPAPPRGSHFAAASAYSCAENLPPATRPTCAFADIPPAIDWRAAPHSSSSALATQNHHRARLRIPAALHPHDHAIFHFRLPPQRRLQIVGIHVRPARRHDHFLLAPLEIKIAGLIERANVARAIPTLVVGDPCIWSTFIRSCLLAIPAPISRRHASTPHQNLAVLRQFHLAPRQHFANRSLPQPERMVHADQRRRLRQPIPLDRRIAQTSPELFGLAVERRAAGNKCPEFPAELPPNRAKRPPPPQVVLLLR